MEKDISSTKVSVFSKIESLSFFRPFFALPFDCIKSKPPIRCLRLRSFAFFFGFDAMTTVLVDIHGDFPTIFAQLVNDFCLVRLFFQGDFFLEMRDLRLRFDKFFGT